MNLVHIQQRLLIKLLHLSWNRQNTEFRTATGGSFLNKNVKSNTATNSIINNISIEEFVKKFMYKPEVYVYHAIIPEPRRPKNIQKNVFPKILF